MSADLQSRWSVPPPASRLPAQFSASAVPLSCFNSPGH